MSRTRLRKASLLLLGHEWLVPGTKSLLIFDDCLLVLVVERRKQALRIVGRKLLPHQKSSAPILPGFHICILNALLQEGVNEAGVFIQDSFERVNGNDDEQVLGHLGVNLLRLGKHHVRLKPLNYFGDANMIQNYEHGLVPDVCQSLVCVRNHFD